MFRNNYDNDSVTFSPQGRIFQVEYAQEALKQGSVVVGLVSKTHAVLVAVKPETHEHPLTRDLLASFLQRNAEELSSYQKKIVGVDAHLGVALAGLSSDGRVLLNFLKQQCLAARLTYGRALPLERAAARLGDRAQSATQHYGKRPYGVGLLLAGADATGPHLFEFGPSGLTQEMAACALGGRSQMARTYLERHLGEFRDCGREELVRHGLRALRESLSQDKELTVENTSVGVVGRAKGEGFKLYDGPEVAPLLEASLEGEGQGNAEEDEGGEGAQPGEGMEVDT